MKQRYLKLCLFTLLAALCCAPATSASVKIGKLYYNLDEATKTAEVSRTNIINYISGALVIPSTVDYDGTTYSVTSIGSGAFYNCSLTSVTLPNSVTSIGYDAFENYSGLKSVHITDLAAWCKIHFVYSNSNPLYYAHKLYLNGTEVKDLVIPDSATEIKDYAFCGCSGLTSVTIPNSATSIGLSAFYNCSGLKKSAYPNHLSNPFSYGMAVAYEPDSTIIENGVIYGAGKSSILFVPIELTSITIPDSVTSIGEYAFSYCSGLTSVTIPNSVTKIGESAFRECTSLTSVTIPNSVTEIGESAFKYCSGLKKSAYPNHLSNPFSYGKTIAYEPNSTIIENGFIYNADKSTILFAPIELTSVTIPNSVTTIGDCTFFYCSGLTSVTIPNSVTEIGNSAFENCSGLASVTIPNSVTEIGNYAFYNCSGLTSVTIPNSVTKIGSSAFEYCSGLTSVTIGSSVTSIGSEAFPYSGVIKAIWLTNTPPEGANNVRATINYVSNNRYGFSNQKVYTSLGSKFEVDNVVYVPVSPSERTCDVIDCNYNPTSKTVTIDSVVTNHNVQLKVLNVNDYAFYSNDSITALTAKNNGNIGDYAFSGCNRVNSLTIGGNVTAIGDKAFYNNKGLREVVIPDSVTSVGESAFEGCSSLDSVTIGKGIKALNASLFKNCSSLGNIRIPGNVNKINDYVFAGCSALQDVTFADASGDETPTITLGSNGSSPMFADCPLDEVYIGRKLSYKASSSYGYSPFYRNLSLKTVKITDKETEIYDNEFYGCSNLQSFECGDGVTKIGKWAFSGCTALQSYASGTSVESIGEEAFSDCTGLTAFATLAAVPPVCGSQALDDINKWECTLHVLPGSVDDYKAADQWKEFFFIDSPSGIDEIETDGIGGDTECGETEVTGYYNLQGVRADEPWDGVNIIVYSDGSRLKVVK